MALVSVTVECKAFFAHFVLFHHASLQNIHVFIMKSYKMSNFVAFNTLSLTHRSATWQIFAVCRHVDTGPHTPCTLSMVFVN